MKPAINAKKGQWEIEFYESLQHPAEPVAKELKTFVPRFFGTREIWMHEKLVRWLILEDACHGLKEPCIMDVKMGRQTWDPCASHEKIQAESVSIVNGSGKFISPRRLSIFYSISILPPFFRIFRGETFFRLRLPYFLDYSLILSLFCAIGIFYCSESISLAEFSLFLIGDIFPNYLAHLLQTAAFLFFQCVAIVLSFSSFLLCSGH